MDEVLYRENAEFAERLLNHSVVGQRNALLVDFAIAALVDQLADRLQVWFTGYELSMHERVRIRITNIPICHIRLNETKHLLGRLSDLDEDTIVDLQ